MWYSLVDSATLTTIAVTQFAPDVSEGQTLLTWPEGVDPVGSFYEPVKDAETGIISLVENTQRKLDAAWTSLRTERNARLAATDWVALADAHLSQDRKDAWFAYRQELRDLPDLVTDEQVTGPSVPWPLVPGSVPVVQATGSRLSSLLTHAEVEPVVEAEPVQEA
jgi:hypothetical protein